MMPFDYVMSVRAVDDGEFSADVGDTRYLIVPPGQDPSPAHVCRRDEWFQTVEQAATWYTDAPESRKRGDLLFVVHGYNMSVAEVIERHRRIRDGLADVGYKGAVVSYDWPSSDSALAYLPDRHSAKVTALRLVTDGIRHLSAIQSPDCPINIHVLGHSTGAYVIREAFDDADDAALKNSAWNVSQVIFAAGDVSAASMSADDSGARSIYTHSVRVTNYSSRHDAVLDLSNVKRVGVAPRVGRVGLPAGAPGKAVNVDCSDYYTLLDTDLAVAAADEPAGRVGAPSHSWYFGNRVFTLDLFHTLIGKDRLARKTRAARADGSLVLARP